MSSFENQATSLAVTAAEIASLRGSIDEARLLRHAKATLVQTGHDNWDGGLDIYALMLEVPISVYADLDERRTKLEKVILDRVQQLIRGYGGVAIGEVVVSPVLVDRARQPAAPDGSEQIRGSVGVLEEAPTYWQPGHFRLFVSHASQKRASAHRLKEALASFQIAAFVAHDDIEPTKEWQPEIETALRTMDALVAIISPEFVLSKWCDQEVGIAIGRNKLVVPLRVGSDPHGFLGKFQGLQTNGSDASAIAKQVFGILLKNVLL
jgi:TIR domain